ncbi:hypothetical protein AGMMS49953_02640 [Endomicrobiia bacterium]|nr:hypothetical protein AGMMS49953_02640 [Endomicrobiia bacterium]
MGISDYFVKVLGEDGAGVKESAPKSIVGLINLTNSDISKTVMIR